MSDSLPFVLERLNTADAEKLQKVIEAVNEFHVYFSDTYGRFTADAVCMEVSNAMYAKRVLEPVTRIEEASPLNISAETSEYSPSPGDEQIVNTLIDRARVLIADMMGVPETQVRPETDIVTDLKADSLDVVEIVLAFEDEFSLEVPDEHAHHLNTPGTAARYIFEYRRRKADEALINSSPSH